LLEYRHQRLASLVMLRAGDLALPSQHLTR
jgi:hypothetical protein